MRKNTFITLLICFVVCQLCVAQDINSKANSLIEKHLAHAGGKNSWQKTKTLIGQGEIIYFIENKVSSGEKTAHYVILPKTARHESSYENNAQRVIVYNGQNSWIKSEKSAIPEKLKKEGTFLPTDERLYSVSLALSFYEERKYPIAYIKSVQENEINYEVVSFFSTYLYFNAQNFMLEKSIFEVEDPHLGKLKFETIFSDYKPVNGLYFPFKVEFKKNGETTHISYSKNIEVDTLLDSAIFEFPKR